MLHCEGFFTKFWTPRKKQNIQHSKFNLTLPKFNAINSAASVAERFGCLCSWDGLWLSKSKLWSSKSKIGRSKTFVPKFILSSWYQEVWNLIEGIVHSCLGGDSRWSLTLEKWPDCLISGIVVVALGVLRKI